METNRTGGKRQMAEINVVPYIDVMLVLLVIFMVTTPLIKQSVKVELPKTAKATTINTKKTKPIEVTVDKKGNYYLSISGATAANLKLSEIGAKVKLVLDEGRKKGNVPDVVVRGDSNVIYGKVVQAMAVLQAAGASSVGLVTVPTGKSR